MKDVNAGLLSSLEHAHAAADAKSRDLVLLNSQLMAEVAQLHAAAAAKDDKIARLKVCPRSYVCVTVPLMCWLTCRRRLL